MRKGKIRSFISLARPFARHAGFRALVPLHLHLATAEHTSEPRGYSSTRTRSSTPCRTRVYSYRRHAHVGGFGERQLRDDFPRTHSTSLNGCTIGGAPTSEYSVLAAWEHHRIISTTYFASLSSVPITLCVCKLACGPDTPGHYQAAVSVIPTTRKPAAAHGRVCWWILRLVTLSVIY